MQQLSERVSAGMRVDYTHALAKMDATYLAQYAAENWMGQVRVPGI